jgi:hypothetical protein
MNMFQSLEIENHIQDDFLDTANRIIEDYAIYSIDHLVKEEVEDEWSSQNDINKQTLTLSKRSDAIAVQSFQVSASIPSHLENDLEKLHGINVQDMLRKTLLNEDLLSFQRALKKKYSKIARLRKKSRWVKFLEDLTQKKLPLYINSVQDLHRLVLEMKDEIRKRTVMNGNFFMVVSLKTSAHLSDSEYYIPLNTTQNFIGGIQLIGKISGVQVFIDPHLSEDEILMGCKLERGIGVYTLEKSRGWFESESRISIHSRRGVKSTAESDKLFLKTEVCYERPWWRKFLRV